jgi:hypothetical protein
MIAPSTCGVAAAPVDLDDEVPVLAEHAVAGSIEAVHVVLEAVPQRDARDHEAVAGLVEQARQQLPLFFGDQQQAGRHQRRDQRRAVRGPGRREVRVIERDATSRHVPARVTDGQFG